VNENERENVFHLADQEAEGGGEGGELVEGGDGGGGVGGRMWGMGDRSGGGEGEREGDRGMADVALPPYRKV
jgi:hypothetical protein